ncbi:MAG: hypothetical protein U9R50_01575 [Campylobacterota bacterium]|nr:hypothetical protein [Campylobacterota bacterium]
MTEDIQNRYISQKRLQNYKNFDEYKQNIHLSEKYYILLSIFEVTFKISKDWLSSSILHEDTKWKIKEAKNKILQRKEIVTHEKIIAELPFGFWTSLFRKSYSNLLRIKDIQFIFPNLPTKNKKMINRNILDKQLNHIRKFRNRVFHYERVINKSSYADIEHSIYELLVYFDKQIYDFAKEMSHEKDSRK